MASDFPLTLEVRGRITSQLIANLKALGVSVDFASSRYGSATVSVSDENQLDALLNLREVEQIEPPPPFVRRAGSALSRAPVALRSEASELGGGSGQIIGIISDSFARTNDVRDGDTTPPSGEAGSLQGSRPQDSGDLPSVVNLLLEGAVGSTDEGAAMAELAFDIAPEAGIAFHAAGRSLAAFATAIDTLCSENRATVVVDDIGFLNEAFYQDDIVAQAAARCVAAGIPYVSSVGNDGDQGFRKIYRDINPSTDDQPSSFVPSGDDLHDWGTGDGFLAVNVPAGERVFVMLQWNQPNASVRSDRGAQIDLDLYATRSDNVAALNPSHPDFVARSIAQQGVTGNPEGDAGELLQLQADQANDTLFYLAVEHYAGSQDDIPQAPGVPLEFRLLLVGSVDSAEYPYNGPTAWGHVAAAGVISTAAVGWWESPAYAPSQFGSVNIDPQPYTSRGGVLEIPFNTAGDYAPQQRIAPTVSGVDGNNNTFFGQDFQSNALSDFGEPDGFPNFFGTSAAAPNVAAVIALLREVESSATPVLLTESLQATAIDVNGNRAAPGDDDVSGAGLVDAGAALTYLRNNRNPVIGPPLGGFGDGSGGPCFIATAAYGSLWHRQVQVLREFRDQVLQTTAVGRWFIERYYDFSPAIAEVIEQHEGLKWLVRMVLEPVVFMIRFPLLLGILPLLLGLWLLRLVAHRHTQAMLSLIQQRH
ncbi:hypothetical protein FHR99_000554 [Litorivivens lipolytica]|uniref:Peptidase S8/S53 domain-containing protein n=1 Tax=Litorivivens lipolytica TaxID=1524264 RepID=A0A7W4W369_9GAMM|nr:CFI-box-CTERM domain-containing protein [Litorivivens lipolytica]MBB3046318.1 hypothetical protein [Litorivivens lipolytica]